MGGFRAWLQRVVDGTIFGLEIKFGGGRRPTAGPYMGAISERGDKNETRI